MLFRSVPWLFFILATLVAPSIPRTPASENDEFLETIRKAHALLEKKCLQNIRIEETVENYKDGVATPGRSVTFLGVSDAYLIKTSELAKDGKGFQERVVVTRPDGRFILAKRPDGPYVLGGVASPKPPLEGMDHFFMWVFPFYSLWTNGKLTDLLAAKTTIFKVIRKDASSIEIEITKRKEAPRSPFHISPMHIILDGETFAVKSVRGRQTLTGDFLSIEAEYTDGFPKTITFKGGPELGALEVDLVHKFPVYRTEAIGKSEFSLKQFGIPDPDSRFRNSWFTRSTFLWFLGAGFLAIVVYFIRQRRLSQG